MTKITVLNSDDVHIITCDGHAGDARVCAGISAIMYGICGYLEERQSALDGLLYKLEDGFSYLEYICHKGFYKDAFDVAVTALRQIADSFPDNANFCEKST